MATQSSNGFPSELNWEETGLTVKSIKVEDTSELTVFNHSLIRGDFGSSISVPGGKGLLLLKSSGDYDAGFTVTQNVDNVTTIDGAITTPVFFLGPVTVVPLDGGELIDVYYQVLTSGQSTIIS